MAHDVNQLVWPESLQAFYNWDEIAQPGVLPHSHWWGSIEWEEAAFIEGWAHFGASAVMYKQFASAPKSIHASIVYTISGGDCVNRYSLPNRREGNVARFFWDVYDTVDDDDLPDTLSLSGPVLVEILARFPAGTGNRQAGEGGYFLADDGPNVYDLKYWMLADGYGSIDINNSIHNNCLQSSKL
jgi:hypothetical protein